MKDYTKELLSAVAAAAIALALAVITIYMFDKGFGWELMQGAEVD